MGNEDRKRNTHGAASRDTWCRVTWHMVPCHVTSCQSLFLYSSIIYGPAKPVLVQPNVGGKNGVGLRWLRKWPPKASYNAVFSRVVSWLMSVAKRKFIALRGFAYCDKLRAVVGHVILVPNTCILYRQCTVKQTSKFTELKFICETFLTFYTWTRCTINGCVVCAYGHSDMNKNMYSYSTETLQRCCPLQKCPLHVVGLLFFTTI